MNNQLDLKFKLSGKFIISKHKLGEEPKVVAEFNNLITANGFNYFVGAGSDTGVAPAIGNVFSEWCAVGSGTNTPLISNTGLQTPIARIERNSPGSQPTFTAGSAPLYGNTMTVTFAFGQGAAAGNLTEIGVGTSTGATAPQITARTLS